MHLEGGGGVGVGIEKPHEAVQLVAPELRTESKSPSYGISFLLQVSTAPKMKWELIHCSPSTIHTAQPVRFALVPLCNYTCLAQTDDARAID